jgi:hypothetical protein
MLTLIARSVVALKHAGICSRAGLLISLPIEAGMIDISVGSFLFVTIPTRGKTHQSCHPFLGRFEYFHTASGSITGFNLLYRVRSTFVMQLLCYLELHVRNGLLHHQHPWARSSLC